MFLTIEACILCLFVGAVVPCHALWICVRGGAAFFWLVCWCGGAVPFFHVFAIAVVPCGQKTKNTSLLHASQKDSCMAEAATVFEIDPIFVFENDPPPGQKLPRPNVFALSTTVGSSSQRTRRTER